MNKVINLYEVAVGLLMLMLEGRKKFVVSFDPKLVVFTQFHLITTLTGKGALYVLAGILFTSSKPFTNFIVGLYTITVGVLCIFYAVKGGGRLKKFKENHPMTSTSEEEIRSKFTYLDTDHDDARVVEEGGGELNDLRHAVRGEHRPHHVADALRTAGVLWLRVRGFECG